MSVMDTAAVVERFGLPERMGPWLEEASELGAVAPGAGLPGRGEAAGALAPFALGEQDVAELVDLWPDASWPPELWWLVERMYARLAADVRLPVGQWREWPSLALVEDGRARCAPVFAFAAAVGLVRGLHARRGVPEQVSAATLADVGTQMERSRAMFGRVSLETADWVALNFRGGMYELGRLQYEPGLMPDEGWGLEGELAPGAPVLRVHIPGGRFSPELVEESLGRARAFFRDRFGREYSVATCTSWLLDPQLARYLPEGSNIVSFQRRFTLLPGGGIGDGDVFRFVYRMPEVDPGAAPRRTRLERAVAEHVLAGGHWRVRTGWLRLP